MDQYLTIQEVCALLRLSERTIYRMCREGDLPGAAKVGGSWRVRRANLEAWLAAGGEAPASPQSPVGAESTGSEEA